MLRALFFTFLLCFSTAWAEGRTVQRSFNPFEPWKYSLPASFELSDGEHVVWTATGEVTHKSHSWMSYQAGVLLAAGPLSAVAIAKGFPPVEAVGVIYPVAQGISAYSLWNDNARHLPEAHLAQGFRTTQRFNVPTAANTLPFSPESWVAVKSLLHRPLFKDSIGVGKPEAVAVVGSVEMNGIKLDREKTVVLMREEGGDTRSVPLSDLKPLSRCAVMARRLMGR